MNTTHRAPRKIPDLPALPTELWLHILRLATWVPDILEPDSVLGYYRTAARDLKRLHRKSLVTKRHIVRVSKQWYQWTVQYLYESILIGRGKTLKPLRNALIESSERAQTKSVPFPLGGWVKRLDLAMRDMSDQEIESENQIEYISDIMQCLPNLVIINFATRPYHVHFDGKHEGYYPASILEAITNTCGPNLLAIAWQDSIPVPKPEGWYALLHRAKCLKALRPPLLRTENMPYFTLPFLESLYLRDHLCGPSNQFTSLRHLIIDTPPSSDNLQLFIQQHGEKLEVVQLETTDDRKTKIAISALASYSPKLFRLDTSLFFHWNTAQMIHVPKRIRVLGLQTSHPQPSKSTYKYLLRRLELMKFDPELEYVQLVDKRNVIDLRSKHATMLVSCSRMLKERGVMLKDHEGNIID